MKKALVLTSLNEKLQPLFPAITNKKMEELLIINSFGSGISQPYGCIIRNILVAVYRENIEEVYIIGEKDSNDAYMDEEELLTKIKEAGISDGIIDTIEYIDVAGESVLKWLAGPEDPKAIVEKNLSLIQKHPLIPKAMPVYGFIANAETKEYEAVS